MSKSAHPVNFNEAVELAEHVMVKTKRTLFIHGSPAVGKSAIAKLIAEKLELKMIDWRGSTADPVDLSGIPDLKGDKAKYIPFDTFPIEGDELPINPVTGRPYKGWLVFMDEFNSAPRSVAAAAYKLVLDREVGLHKLHENVHLMAAGNLATDGAIVNEHGTALASRFIHLMLEVSQPVWMRYAISADYDPRVVAYIAHRPSHLYNFEPTKAEFTYPSPRTWEFVSDIIKGAPVGSDLLPLLAGSVGDGTAIEFRNFCMLSDKLPKFDEILADPMLAKLPEETSYQYATIAMMVDHMKTSNADKAMVYVERLNREHQYLIVKMLIEKDSDFIDVTAIDNWLDTNANFVYGD